MTQSHRLPEGGRIDRAAPLAFTFNGTTYEGYAGDTLASALLANGVHFVARSFKYHRPRGIVTAGVEEPNALVQLESGARAVPNPRATEIELYDGLRASSVNALPDIERDRLAILQKLGRFLPPGFYYKTFMWPRRLWPRYEAWIRGAAGLGIAPSEPDADRYDKTYAHCDVLVVGAGPAGLTAAHTAGSLGARVMLVDDQPEPGGALLSSAALLNGRSGDAWAGDVLAELRAMPEVRVLTRTTAFGYHDHNFLTACQRLTDHLPLAQRRGPRERLWKIRARQVILATGAHERPIVFGNNDLPGIVLASAVSTYIHRYGVLPGRRAVIFTNNDSGYHAALDLRAHGADVAIVDPRPAGDGPWPAAARGRGIPVISESIVIEAHGELHVGAVTVASYRSGLPGNVVGRYECDLLALSGGWNPALHLHAQSGGKARWDEGMACFVPGDPVQAARSVGAANGEFSTAGAIRDGMLAGRDAAAACGCAAPAPPAWPAVQPDEDPILPLWLAGERRQPGRGASQFVDYQNDVTAADIHLAAREGYESIEHVKRYTMLGFGTDQGKLGNVNAMALLAGALGRTIPETGTTTFRPNYTPVAFGTLAGRELGGFLDPVRKTCLHEWHAAHGAVFEDVGNWKRPWYYASAGEDLRAATARECLAVRNAVGLLDASTLGKIDVRGADAAVFLDWFYTNRMSTLAAGKCRYGLMLDENGMVFDDGVTVRLADNHFLVSTTTGGAARVLAWMERWLQTEWPQLKVHLTSVSEHYATFALAGPRARRVLQRVCHDVDCSKPAFPFMSWCAGTVAGAPARIMRISFSGEVAYEVNVPADLGRSVWEALIAAGSEHGITPYGTEAMHVLRAEKGYIIAGQDTDGSVTPHDLGMSDMVAKNKDFLGRRSLMRAHTKAAGRKQLVGLLTLDPACVLPEGAQILNAPAWKATAPMVGHVTSSYLSPALKRSIALALIQDGHGRMGQEVAVSLARRRHMRATICNPVFHDRDGVRLRG